VSRRLGREVDPASIERRPAEPDALDVPTAGSDESGKGDYFGPLAVAGVLVQPKDADLLRELGIMDSKMVGEQRIRSTEGLLAQALPHAVRVLTPEAYNAEWARERNVNKILGRLHAEVLEEVMQKAKDPSASRIVVDQFGDPSYVVQRLGPRSKRADFRMHPRGESNPAVAAGSFLARAAFLRGFDEVRDLSGEEGLPRGASDPRIVPIARRLFREGGEAWLGRFAKLHFRITERVR
jgi:ribonuclease HIII